MNCYNDWADQFMDKAIDNVSGRLHEPLTMSEEHAWRKVYNTARWDNPSLPLHVERNMITREERPCQDN